MCPPKQGPQVGVEITQPASINISNRPSFIASRYIFCVAGIIIVLTFFATCLPLNTSAAFSKSSSLPLVHEPITHWSILTSPTWSIVFVFSGRCGNATVGFSSDKSMSYTFSYSASSSAVYTVYSRLTLSLR